MWKNFSPWATVAAAAVRPIMARPHLKIGMWPTSFNPGNQPIVYSRQPGNQVIIPKVVTPEAGGAGELLSTSLNVSLPTTQHQRKCTANLLQRIPCFFNPTFSFPRPAASNQESFRISEKAQLTVTDSAAISRTGSLGFARFHLVDIHLFLHQCVCVNTMPQWKCTNVSFSLGVLLILSKKRRV